MDRQVDVLVAEKIMGWFLNISTGERVWTDGTGQYVAHVDPNAPTGFKFTPSTDIQDAWKVIEKLQENQLGVAITSGIEEPSKSWKYVVEIHDYKIEAIYVEETENVVGFCLHESAPMAICLAALKSIGVDLLPDKFQKVL